MKLPDIDELESAYDSTGTRPDTEAKQRRHDESTLTDQLEIEHHNRDRLVDIFSDEFHPDDPPESYRRFEQYQTMKRLVFAVHSSVGGSVVYETDEMKTGYAAVPKYKLAKIEGHDGEGKPDIANQAIDLLADYGEPAEQFLAAIVSTETVPEEQRLRALEQLKGIRESKDEVGGFWEELKLAIFR